MTDPSQSAPVPPLRTRVLQLAAIGYALAAIRLGLDFWDRDAAMWFGLYYGMPVAILVFGVRRQWGPIPWRAMALTMVVVAVLVWGVWNSISYTIGQFMEWTDGRYFPGHLQPDGSYSERRAAPLMETGLAKVGAGLRNGAISSLTGSVWCVLAGTLFLWRPRGTFRQGAEDTA